jgi:hypothetical protein
MGSSGDRSPQVANGSPRSFLARLATWLGLAIVALLAIHRLRDFPTTLSWRDAFEGVRAVAGSTVPAALRVWLFWAVSAGVIAGCALRVDADLELSDAILIGCAGPWVLAPVIGNMLGPVGLLSGATLWGLLALGAAWLWRRPPRFKLHALTSGQKLALLATGLLAVSYLPLQLASPVVPFMDVLSYPSSVQRILTFHVYLPFDNDPYGCWGRYAVTPYLELFYTILALGSGLHLAVLAESAAMMPMAALLIFSAYRLGKTIFCDTAGGMASLLLFATCLFRRAQGMRGTAVAFVLIGLGFAFFMDSQRRRITLAVGAAMLGTAVGSHAIDGALGLITAGIGLSLWLAEGDFNRFLAGAIALAGASLCAVPELLVGLDSPMPYPVIPLILLGGGALIVAGAAVLSPAVVARRDFELRVSSVLMIGGLVFLTLFRHAFAPDSLYAKVESNLPLLFVFSFAGLVAALGIVLGEQPLRCRYAALAAVTLMLGLLADCVDPALRAIGHTAATQMMTGDVSIKLTDYWSPYFLIFPAGFLFALACDRWSAPLTLFVLLTILIYPWQQFAAPVDYDSLEHAISEQWAFNLHTAATGYWIGDNDHHWKFDHDGWRLIEALNQEIAAGRITPATHILHLTDTISSWSMVQFSIMTGINDDPIEYQHDPNNQWEGGSRVRGLDQLGAAMKDRPPYILIQDRPPAWFRDPPPGYDQIYLNYSDLKWRPYAVRLYRRQDLAGFSPPPASASFGRRLGLGLLLMVLAFLILVLPGRWGLVPVAGGSDRERQWR